MRYWHLDVPADVSLGCNADRAHRGGTTGSGVTVAMVDTGWQSHPWFVERGYRVDPTLLGPGTADAGVDENGHGTGESANIFATAPDVLLKPVKAALASRRAREHDGRLQRRRRTRTPTSSPTAGRRASSSAR